MQPTALQSVDLYIDGKFRSSRSGHTFTTLNPATESALAEVPEATAEDVDEAVMSARRAFEKGEWPRMPAARRSQILYEAAALIEERATEIAELETADTGMTINMTRFGHVPRSAAHFRHFAEEAERSKGESYPLDAAYLYVVDRVPMGVVSIFAPWNAPLAVASINIAAALAFGNCCVLKPSENSPLSAFALAQILEKAGVPAGVVNVIQGRANPTGRALAEHPSVNMIHFVGGTTSGRSIMKAASAHLVRVGLELGGKSPSIIFSDADLEKAVDGTLLAAFSSNGEVCTAASRILVERAIFQEVVDRLVTRAERIKVGDPMLPETEMGPLISAEHHHGVSSAVESAVRAGATIRCGGHRPVHLKTGHYFLPTILCDVANQALIAQEEVFGPVTIVIPFNSVEEAIGLANDSMYGLAAYVWSQDSSKALQVASSLRAGTVTVNCPVVRDVRVPFGGFGQSGMGRVGGTYSRDLFTEPRTTCIPIHPYTLPQLGRERQTA